MKRVLLGILFCLLLLAAGFLAYEVVLALREYGAPYRAEPSSPRALSDVRVRVYETDDALLPFEPDGTLHIFCNRKTGKLIVTRDRTLAVVKGGCR